MWAADKRYGKKLALRRIFYLQPIIGSEISKNFLEITLKNRILSICFICKATIIKILYKPSRFTPFFFKSFVYKKKNYSNKMSGIVPLWRLIK